MAMSASLLTVVEAAAALRVSRRRAQAAIESGALPAERLGSQWTIPVAAVRRYDHTRCRQPGRPLKVETAWEVIADLEAGIAPHRSRVELDRLRRSLRPRARHLYLHVHPAMLERIRDHPAVVAGGRIAAAANGRPVDPGDDIDAYVRGSDAHALCERVKAQPVTTDENVRLHVVDDRAWPFAPEQRQVGGWVSWLDLEDQQDRAADTVLDQLIGGRLRA
jgi:excisionase family DNA binding protein